MTTPTTTLASADPVPADLSAANGAAAPPANSAGDAAELLAAYSATASLLPVDAPRLARFGYVIDSPPAELAANVERAIEDIVAEAGGSLPCERGALAARDLCEVLRRFLQPRPEPGPGLVAERVGAFWGVFPVMVAFLRRVGEPPFEPPGAASDPARDKVFGSPVVQLCRALFAAHRRLGEEGGGFDGELLAGLELALESYDAAAAASAAAADRSAGGRGREALAGLLGHEAGYLFVVDADWTQKHVFARIGRGGAYRQNTAQMLVRYGGRSSPEFMACVQPFLFELCADIEAVFGSRGGRVQVVEWLHLFADRALEDNDEATIAQITDLLRVMPETCRGNFIGILRRRFDSLHGYYEELSDRELHQKLSDRLSTPQFIRTFWPPEPQCQTDVTTRRFVDLLLHTDEHAEDVFEACRDFLVPIEDEREQYRVFSKLVHDINHDDFIQANPAVVAGIIDRTTNEHSNHLKELTELKTHITSETPPIAAP